MKKIKVFFNGERLRDIYPHATKFQVFKWKLRRFVRKVVLVLMGVAVIGVSLFIGSQYSPKVVYHAQAERIVTIDSLKNKVDEMKVEVIEALANCESSGASDDDALIVYDNNSAGTLKGKNIPSIGSMQWKITTVQFFEKMRSGKVLTNKEAVELALNGITARDLADYAIFETKGGIYHWANCEKKLALAPKVEIIKNLAK